jgi:hypothetical protein
MPYIGTSYASLDGTSTTVIITREDDRKRYGMRLQGATGDLTTAKFRTLKGARAFKYERLNHRYRGLVSRERNLDSKAKRTVYDYILRYHHWEYVTGPDTTPLIELNKFFPPE